MSKRTLIHFSDIAKQSVITLYGADLSPDGSRLAVLNLLTKTVELEVYPVDGAAMVDIGPATKAHWSADGQRLYYLRRITPDQCAPATIHAYDFATYQDKIVLGPEVTLSPTQSVTLDACEHSFLISPAEDAALLVLGESGSWIVGLP